MTEDEWLRETRPTVMLYHLVLMRTKLVLLSWIGARGDRESGRKLRLFVCACARRLWPQLSTGGREVVEACERHADGLTPASALEPLRKTMDGDPTADVLLSVALTSSPWFPFQFDRGEPGPARHPSRRGLPERRGPVAVRPAARRVHAVL